MIRRLYNWTMALAEHPRALWALGIVAFIEASVFPIPPDVLIIPMVLAAPRRAFLIAGVAVLGSVLGALLGYFIGYALFESVGLPVLEFYGKADGFGAFAERYNEYGAWAVLIAGLTPFPFKVITIASGATQLSLPVFVLSAIVARSIRFFLVAALLWWGGPPIKAFIEKHLGWFFALFCLLLVGGFYMIRFL